MLHSSCRGVFLRSSFLFFGLQLADRKKLHDHLLEVRLADAAPHLAHEVLLKSDLGQVYPFALRRPVDVARWGLRVSDEGEPAVAEIGRQIASGRSHTANTKP